MSLVKRKVNFNQAYAQSVTKEQFIKDHPHHAADVDLGKAWEDLQEKQESSKKEVSK